MNLKFYTDSKNTDEILFFYRFDKIKYYSTSSSTISIYNVVKYYGDNILLIKLNDLYNNSIYKFYIVISPVDENNNIKSFNQRCYIIKLKTENINSNYIVEEVNSIFESYIKAKVDIY